MSYTHTTLFLSKTLAPGPWPRGPGSEPGPGVSPSGSDCSSCYCCCCCCPLWLLWQQEATTVLAVSWFGALHVAPLTPPSSSDTRGKDMNRASLR